MLHALARSAKDRPWLRIAGNELPANEAGEWFNSMCHRRLNHEPMAYIMGYREFYGLRLSVDARVLDPRPDTETLVDWALELLTNVAAPSVADLGTGSGAIALAIKHQRPDADVVATDFSADALAVARANAANHRLDVSFCEGSWLEPLATLRNAPDNGWHLIVSNPPYIAQGDEHLAALMHEPSIALVSGSDGLDDIRNIIIHAPKHLSNDGWLLLEHGYNQAKTVQMLMHQQGFDHVQSRNDLSGVERCTGGLWRGGGKTG